MNCGAICDQQLNFDENDNMEDDVVHDACQTDPQWEAAIFLMRAADELNLIHAGIAQLCASCKWLTDVITQNMASKLRESLQESNLLIPEVNAVIDRQCHSTNNLFDNLQDRCYRESYYSHLIMWYCFIILIILQCFILLIFIYIETRTYSSR